MASSITSKGKAWEYRNSLWMLWTILSLGFLNYVSFFYISHKVKQKKWFIAALVYSGIFVLYMSLPDFFTPIFLISWIFSVFHVFKVRTEYLLRLEAVQASGLRNRDLDKLKETISREYDKPNSAVQSSNARFEERESITPFQSREKEVIETDKSNVMEKRIDINTASEEQIASVPGVGSIFAAKIVALRKQENGFHSFDHFVQALSVKPHLAEKMKSHMKFSDTSRTNQEVKRAEGRIVDF